jgi:hypothetical protein
MTCYSSETHVHDCDEIQCQGLIIVFYGLIIVCEGICNGKWCHLCRVYDFSNHATASAVRDVGQNHVVDGLACNEEAIPCDDEALKLVKIVSNELEEAQ